MNLLGAMILVTKTLAQCGQDSPPPVVIVDDPKEVQHAIGVRVDTIYTPSQNQAEAPRQDLARYLEAERRHENANTARLTCAESASRWIGTSGTVRAT